MDKGTLGYIDALKKRYGLYALILAVLILAGVLVVGLLFRTLKHAAIIIPVLITLPFAWLLVQWVIVAKFHSLKREEGEWIEERLSQRRNCVVLYDMALSSYEAISFASCLVIDQGNIYLLWGGSNEKSYGEEQQREYVQGIIQKTGYPFLAYTVHSVDELLEQVTTAEITEADLSSSCDRLRQRMLDISV